jgi:hypothetical protein
MMQTLEVIDDDEDVKMASPDDLLPSIKKLNEATINKIGNSLLD